MAYTRKSWENGEVITATALNNIEDGIVELKQATTGFSNNLDTQKLNISGDLEISETTTTKNLSATGNATFADATFSGAVTINNNGSLTVPTPNDESNGHAAASKEYVDDTKNALTTQMNNTFALKTTTIQAGNGLTLASGGTLNENTTLSLKIAGRDILGGIKVGSNLTIDSSTGVLNATDTTYSVATATTDGLMSAADKGKLDNSITSITMNDQALAITNNTVELNSVIPNISNKANTDSPNFTGTATFGDVTINANNSTLSIGNNSLNEEKLKNLCDFLPGDTITNGHTYTLQLTKNNDTLLFTWVQVPENGGE